MGQYESVQLWCSLTVQLTPESGGGSMQKVGRLKCTATIVTTMRKVWQMYAPPLDLT